MIAPHLIDLYEEAFHWTFWAPDVKTGEKFLHASEEKYRGDLI